MAVNAATELVSDAETLELIQALDAEFYGPEEESSSRSSHRGTHADSDDEYLSPTEDETDTRRSIGQMSEPE